MPHRNKYKAFSKPLLLPVLLLAPLSPIIIDYPFERSNASSIIATRPPSWIAIFGMIVTLLYTRNGISKPGWG